MPGKTRMRKSAKKLDRLFKEYTVEIGHLRCQDTVFIITNILGYANVFHTASHRHSISPNGRKINVCFMTLKWKEMLQQTTKIEYLANIKANRSPEH